MTHVFASLARRANSLTHIERMPSISLNCFTLLCVLPLLLRGGLTLIFSAATAVTHAGTRADTFATTDAYDSGLPKNSRAGTTAAKV